MNLQDGCLSEVFLGGTTSCRTAGKLTDFHACAITPAHCTRDMLTSALFPCDQKHCITQLTKPVPCIPRKKAMKSRLLAK